MGWVDMNSAFSAVLQKIHNETKVPFLIAIDGRCASGKTTLAEMLEKETGCNVVHMDHFFLRPQQRTPERFKESGGNVDYERFLEEVLLPFSRNQAVSYRPFDCKKMELSAPVSLNSGRVTVVEGSYSCHPALWDYYDFRVFLSIDFKEQIQRISKRNGEDALEMFKNRWIPFEEQYFSAYQIKERCDIVFDCSDNSFSMPG